MSFEISYDLTKSLYMACLCEDFFSNTFRILFFRISNSTQILSNFISDFIYLPNIIQKTNSFRICNF
jgi:hypothetical protein